jgi:hypothetical protein
MLLIGKRPNGRILLLLAPGSGVAAERITWLFGIEVLPGSGFAALSIGRPDAGGVHPPRDALDWEAQRRLYAAG